MSWLVKLLVAPSGIDVTYIGRIERGERNLAALQVEPHRSASHR